MEGPNRSNRSVVAFAIVTQHINAQTCRMATFIPRLLDVNLTSSTHAFPRQVGGDPPAGLCVDFCATFRPIMDEVLHAIIATQTHESNRMVLLNIHGCCTAVENKCGIVIAIEEGARLIGCTACIPRRGIACQLDAKALLSDVVSVVVSE